MCDRCLSNPNMVRSVTTRAVSLTYATCSRLCPHGLWLRMQRHFVFLLCITLVRVVRLRPAVLGGRLGARYPFFACAVVRTARTDLYDASHVILQLTGTLPSEVSKLKMLQEFKVRVVRGGGGGGGGGVGDGGRYSQWVS